MPDILVSDVPDDVYAALVRKAGYRHQTLQQYLQLELSHLSERRELGEILDDIES